METHGRTTDSPGSPRRRFHRTTLAPAPPASSKPKSLLVALLALAGLGVLPPGSSLAAQVPAGSWTPPPLPTFHDGFEELRPGIEARIEEHRGVVGLVLLDPETGELLAIRGDERFPSASVIKLPILYEVMLRVEEGRLSLDDPLVMLAGDPAPGAGVLGYLSPPFRLTVRDAAFLMIALSDNTATNLLLEKVEPRSVGERMAELGLTDSRVFRKVFGDPLDSFDPPGSREWGLGVTTPMDQARLLAWIHRGEAVSPQASEEMLGMLDAQFYRESLPRLLPEGTRVAHKNGTIAAARHDCGIVFGPSREYVVCVMTRENEDTSRTHENEAELLIAELSRMIFDGLGGAR